MIGFDVNQPPPDITAIDCVQTFVDLWERVSGLTAEDIVAAWTSDYVDRLPGPVLASWHRHRFPGDIEQATAKMPAAIDDLIPRRDAIQTAADTGMHRFTATLGITPDQFQMATMVGAFGADGWVDLSDGIATLVIAVEALESAVQAELLVRHEIAHVLHLQLMPGHEHWDVGDALFEEGLATALSGIGMDSGDGTLCAGGRSTTWQGEPVDAWAARCAESWPAIRERILATFSSEDHGDYEALFLGGSAAPDLPSRSGYYAGLRAVRTLAESTSWPEIVRWGRVTAQSAIHRALLEDP